MFIKNIGIKNPYENPLRLLSRVPLLENVKAKIVPAKNAPSIASISKNTEIPTRINIKAIELLMPSSSGSLPSKDQKYSLYCAVIVKKVDEKTRSKTSINDLLRD